MDVVIGVILGLLALVILVTAHEFGHFIAARKNGVEVEEFGICFPPRAIAWRKVKGKWRRLKKSEWDKAPGEGTIISLNWLPIGGFCQMKGENDDASEKGTFGKASYWSKTKILFAGVTANWIVAAVIFTALAFVGMPHFMENQFQVDIDTEVYITKPVTLESIEKDSPADNAGLQAGDVVKSMRILKCDNEECTEGVNERYEILTTDDLLGFLDKYAGESVYMSFTRNGDEMTAPVTLNASDKDYILGAAIDGELLYMSSWSSPIVGIGTTIQLTGETFKGVGQLIVNLFSGIIKQVNFDQSVRESGAEELQSAGDSVTGPVGIVGILFPNVAKAGGRSLAFFVAIISVSLACMNVLPIPALDGGRWLMITIARLRKKKLSKATEEKIVGRSFIVILILAVVITILDIMRFF